MPGQTGAWVEWDVTADIQAFVNDPEVSNYGWLLMDPEPWGMGNIPRAYFRTKEHDSYHPYLTVVPEPGTLVTLALGTAAVLRRR